MLVADEVLIANQIDDNEIDDESIEKCGKLSKTRKLFKSQKLSKSQKSAKSRKKLSKSGNLHHFDAKKNGPSFLTPDIRMAFNYLWLTFTKALILGHFDPESPIWIEADVSGYVIDDVLSQLVFETRPNKIVTKTNLG